MIRQLDQAYATNHYAGMSPERLILALYDGALASIERAEEALAAGALGPKGEAASRALAIVGELRAVLDEEKGGELAQRLGALYDYLIARLLDANLKGDRAGFAEARCLIAEVREGWVGMMEALPSQKKAAAGGGYF